jgi:hypothetical protein
MGSSPGAAAGALSMYQLGHQQRLQSIGHLGDLPSTSRSFDTNNNRFTALNQLSAKILREQQIAEASAEDEAKITTEGKLSTQMRRQQQSPPQQPNWTGQ